jgi:hypothetical protein
METLNELIEALKENFDILFSGAGTEIIKLVAMIIAGFFAWISKNLIVTCLNNIRRRRTKQIESSPPSAPAPARTKNRLTKPIFNIECMSYGGTRGISQFAGFKITNQGGSAYNVEISGECLPKNINIGDIMRQRNKNFRVDLNPHDHWETLNFQIHYLDGDGDEGKQGLWLRWENGGRGYVVPE